VGGGEGGEREGKGVAGKNKVGAVGEGRGGGGDNRRVGHDWLNRVSGGDATVGLGMGEGGWGGVGGGEREWSGTGTGRGNVGGWVTAESGGGLKGRGCWGASG